MIMWNEATKTLTIDLTVSEPGVTRIDPQFIRTGACGAQWFLNFCDIFNGETGRAPYGADNLRVVYRDANGEEGSGRAVTLSGEVQTLPNGQQLYIGRLKGAGIPPEPIRKQFAGQ